MSRIVWCCALVAACAALQFSPRAIAQEAAPPAVRPVTLGELEARIEAALGEPTSLQFLEQPLGDVVAFLEDRHKIEFQLDRQALDTCGVSTDTPVTIDVQGISLRSALNLMLKSIELTYCVRDGVLLITTTEEVERFAESRVYDVHRFVDDVDEFGAYRRDRQSVIELIVSQIAPTSWPDGTGPVAGVSVTGRSLVVSQTQENQKLIDRFVLSLNTAVDRFKEGSFNEPIEVTLDDASATRRLQMALDELTSLQFLEQPLGDVVAFLEDRHKIEIQLDTQALDTAGVTRDTPVTIDVEGIPLRNALNLMLAEIELTYTIRDEVLLITTAEELEQQFETRIYPVKDLLDAELAASPPRSDRLDFPVNSLNGPRDPHAIAAENLVELVALAGTPDDGCVLSGYGAVTFVPQCEGIVVTQSDDFHRRLDRLFADLREAQAKLAAQNPIAADNTVADQVTLRPYRLAHYTSPSQPVKDLDKLARLLRRSVNPASWTDSPDQNSMETIDDALLIQTTNANHKQIQALLKQLGFRWRAEPGTSGGFQTKADEKQESEQPSK